MRILVVEDDREMAGLLHRGLSAEGYDVTVAPNGLDGLVATRSHDYQAAAVDVMLPGMNGFEFCRHVRETGSTMPILLLTARDAVEDRVQGLDSGADDYLTKPFAFAELAARMRALLRRDPAVARPTLTVGSLGLDVLDRRATIRGKELALSPREFTLLRLLATRVGALVTRGTILEEVWGTSQNVGANVIDQYISYLRRKLDAASSDLQIVTERGRGYRLVAPPETRAE